MGHMQTTYIYLDIIALFIISILGFLAYKNRKEKCAKSFIYVMIFMSIWTMSSTAELLLDSFFWKLLFRNMIQFGMAFVAIANYSFVLIYTEDQKIVRKQIFYGAIGLNSIGMLLLFTDQLTHLLRSDVYMVYENGNLGLFVTSTLLGAFFVIIRFALFGYATVLLFLFLFKTFNNMRKQVIIILIGFCLALISLMLKEYWLEDLGLTVPMSVILIIPFMFIGFGIFRYDFLTISPIAKNWVIDSLSEGIIVLSKDGELLEKNISATKFLEVYDEQIDIQQLEESCDGIEDSIHQLKVIADNKTAYLEITIHNLLTTNDKKRGAVAVIRDISEHINRHNELLEKVDIDGLTQVYNKKALERKFDVLEEAFSSLMIIDIDRFKIVNDTYGHPVGDIVLVGIVEAMKKTIRKEDFIGRIGGDEFGIILSVCSNERCHIIAKRLLEAVNTQQYDVGFELPPITISIGAVTNIISAKMTFEEAYKEADKALYKAKEQGRNCYVIC